jgi:hypothetical protein
VTVSTFAYGESRAEIVRRIIAQFQNARPAFLPVPE